MKKKTLGITLIALMALSLLPVVTSAAPSFQINDGWDGELRMMAPPDKCSPWPSCKDDGGSGGSSQEVDWGVARIGALAASSGVSRSGITVAVLDTGVDSTHADLQGLVVACFSGIQRADYSDCTDRKVADDDGHGTHVAGTIAALNNDQDTVGVFSGVSIINGKVLGKRGGDWNDLAWSIRHAADLGADVISMSLGGDISAYPETQQTLQDAVDYAINSGAAVVAAAGNEGTCEAGDVQKSWPAMNDGVFTVGATGIVSNGEFVTEWTGAEDDVMPCFSNDMPSGVVDISAPGVYITASQNKGGVTDLSGTSMATPHVSAAIAMLMAQGSSASSAQNTLVNGALDLGYSSTMQGAGLMLLS